MTESRVRTKQAALFPVYTLLYIQHHNTVKWAAHPGKYLRLNPLQHNRCTKTKKYGPNERTNQNSRKRTKP